MSEADVNLAELPADQRLIAAATRFDFFQAVRILERTALEAEKSGEERTRHQKTVPVGEDGPLNREPVRFRGLPSLGFPASPIVSVTRPQKPAGEGDFADHTQQSPADMLVAFMGLAGPSGVLPDHYTSQLIERVRYKDFGLKDFLDLFNHRLISLFYRAWEKYRFETAYERKALRRKNGEVETEPSTPWAGSDDFTSMLMSMVGLGTGALQNRTTVKDETLIFYAGHFAHQSRSATSLELVLNDYFEMPVEVRQFQGQWMPLAEDDRSQLGRAFCGLGTEVVLGKRVWDVQGKFRVRVGPLTFKQYVELLPGSMGLRKMFDLIRLYVGLEFDFDVQPLLKASEIPECKLGVDRKDPSRVPGKLGRNFWLVSRPATEEFDGAVFASAVA